MKSSGLRPRTKCDCGLMRRNDCIRRSLPQIEHLLEFVAGLVVTAIVRLEGFLRGGKIADVQRRVGQKERRFIGLGSDLIRLFQKRHGLLVLALVRQALANVHHSPGVKVLAPMDQGEGQKYQQTGQGRFQPHRIRPVLNLLLAVGTKRSTFENRPVSRAGGVCPGIAAGADTAVDDRDLLQLFATLGCGAFLVPAAGLAEKPVLDGVERTDRRAEAASRAGLLRAWSGIVIERRRFAPSGPTGCERRARSQTSGCLRPSSKPRANSL
jgi:hypothetical protein